MTTNPNFPEHLDINPSTFLQFSSPSKLQSTDDDLDRVLFGDHAQRMAIQKYGIAGRVWEAAYALSLYVNPPSTMKFDPPFVQATSLLSSRTMLELGSGTGMVSSHIAETLDINNDIIIVTDLPEVCPLLENNLMNHKSSNSPRVFSDNTGNVHVRPLSWGDEGHCKCIADEFFAGSSVGTPRRLSHIICSDLVYFPELLAPLLRTLIRLTSSPFYLHPILDKDVNKDLVVIISYKIRSLSKESPFWSAFGLWFKFEPVLVKDTTLEGDWQRFSLPTDDVIFVFVARRRPESYAWEMPTTDKELLDGRGARGDNSVKADDTFETLLFMTLEES